MISWSYLFYIQMAMNVMMTEKATVCVMMLTIELNAIMITEIVVTSNGLVMENVIIETTSQGVPITLEPINLGDQ